MAAAVDKSEQSYMILPTTELIPLPTATTWLDSVVPAGPTLLTEPQRDATRGHTQRPEQWLFEFDIRTLGTKHTSNA